MIIKIKQYIVKNMRQNMINNCLINNNSLSDSNLLKQNFYNNLKHKHPIKQNKKVSFYNEVYVMLIPAIKDYQNSGLCDDLWWSKNELNQFSKENKFNTTDS